MFTSEPKERSLFRLCIKSKNPRNLEKESHLSQLLLLSLLPFLPDSPTRTLLSSVCLERFSVYLSSFQSLLGYDHSFFRIFLLSGSKSGLPCSRPSGLRSAVDGIFAERTIPLSSSAEANSSICKPKQGGRHSPPQLYGRFSGRVLRDTNIRPRFFLFFPFSTRDNSSTSSVSFTEYFYSNPHAGFSRGIFPNDPLAPR